MTIGNNWEGKIMNKDDGKKEVFWLVRCLMCQTSVCLGIGDFRIISTDQAAEFIKVPSFICGKCKSVCQVKLTD